MSSLQVAAPPKKAIRPAFTVEKLEGKRMRPFIVIKDGLSKEEMREVDAGFMVTLMQGHSVHIWTKEDLERLELDRTIPMVQEGGDDAHVGSMPSTLKKGK